MTLDEFKADFAQYLNSISDEELRAALERAGCLFQDSQGPPAPASASSATAAGAAETIEPQQGGSQRQRDAVSEA